MCYASIIIFEWLASPAVGFAVSFGILIPLISEEEFKIEQVYLRHSIVIPRAGLKN